MRSIPYQVVFVCLLLTGRAATLAAPVQDVTQAPGQPTQARVWIQNHGASEAVPVAIQPLPADAPPLRVQVAGEARRSWEYRVLQIPTGQDAVSLLNAAGAEGWEATGVAVSSQSVIFVLMKRPR